jgi:hypothetical protein
MGNAERNGSVGDLIHNIRADLAMIENESDILGDRGGSSGYILLERDLEIVESRGGVMEIRDGLLECACIVIGKLHLEVSEGSAYALEKLG